MSGGAGPRRVRMAGGPEFARIESFLRAAAADPGGPEVVLGPGDDAAVLSLAPDEAVVIGLDLSVEEVHFRRAWLGWESVGWRAAAAALSDLAAMAARPLGALVALALPPELDAGVGDSLAAGLGACLRRAGAALLGGDLSASPGPVILDVTAVGAAARPIGRAGARPGDELWVTGALGGAAAAAAAWERGLEPDPRARRAFERPTPRVGEARWLAAHGGARALIDLSDGLAGDARHLAAASGVRLEIVSEAVPLHDVLLEWRDREAALRVAAGGGEDYELLLAAAPGLAPLAPRFREELGCELCRIGRVREGSGVVWLDAAGREREAPTRGFDHFARGGPA